MSATTTLLGRGACPQGETLLELASHDQTPRGRRRPRAKFPSYDDVGVYAASVSLFAGPTAVPSRPKFACATFRALRNPLT